MNGYELTIKVFIPADPKIPATMSCACDLIDSWIHRGAPTDTDPNIQWVIGKPRWIARRKITTVESGHGTATLLATHTPDASPKAVTSEATDMPEIPGFLDRQGMRR